MSIRAYKFRLEPTSAQALGLDDVLSAHRWLYNECLDQRVQAWREFQVSASYYDQANWLWAERRFNPRIGVLNYSSSQATLRRVQRSFENFFRRVKENQEGKARRKPGFPRFKGVDQFKSFEFPSVGDGVGLDGNRLRVQGIKGLVSIRKHRDEEGKTKTIRVKKEAGHWFAILSCELPDVPLVPNGRPAVGVDVGLCSFLVDSEGNKTGNPRFLQKSLKELRRANRSLARKKLASRKRQEAKLRLQRIQARVADKRRDFLHKLANEVVGSHGLVAVERLNIQGMTRKRRKKEAKQEKGAQKQRKSTRTKRRNIHDASWGMFREMLRYKAASAGCEVIEVDPRGTSQDCSRCGTVVPKDETVRWHECPRCGLSLDRDHNAARNILLRALDRTGPAAFISLSPTQGSGMRAVPPLAPPGSLEKPSPSGDGEGHVSFLKDMLEK